MSDAFDALFAKHALSAYARQLILADALDGQGGWDADLAAGTLSFEGGDSYACGLLGSFGEAAGTWRWAWANDAMQGLPDEVLAAARTMQEIGNRQDVPELREPEFPADEDLCHRLAMVTVGETGAGAYYRGPYGGGAAYLVLREPLPRTEPHTTARIIRVIGEGTSTFELPHREAVTAYLAAEGLSVEDGEQEGEIIATAEDGTVRLRFDGLGRIAEMKGMMAAQRKKGGGWLGKLFGKDE